MALLDAPVTMRPTSMGLATTTTEGLTSFQSNPFDVMWRV